MGSVEREARADIVGYVVDQFMNWWNRLARKTGKLKFRNREEAAEFIRKVQMENGGPNDKIRAMREKYESINAGKASGESGPK